MKRAVVGAVGSMTVALTFGTGVAFAGGPGFPTELQISAFTGSPARAFAFGSMTSPRKACISGRTVRTSLVIEGEREPLDIDTASLNGFVAGGGAIPFGSAVELRMRAPRTRLGPGRTCAPGSDTFLLGPSLVAGAGATLSGGPGYSTEVEVDVLGGDPASGGGALTSPRRACISGRRVRVFAVIAGENELIDSDRASANGFFAGGGPASGAHEGVRVRAPRKRLGPGRFCAPGSDALFFPA